MKVSAIKLRASVVNSKTATKLNIAGILLTIDFEKDSIYSKDQVTFSNKEGRISGKKLKANSNFTFFKLSDISDSHVNYEVKE